MLLCSPPIFSLDIAFLLSYTFDMMIKMNYGGCQECGAWIEVEAGTGYVDEFCSQACIDAREANQALDAEDEESRREAQAQEEYHD